MSDFLRDTAYRVRRSIKVESTGDYDLDYDILVLANEVLAQSGVEVEHLPEETS